LFEVAEGVAYLHENSFIHGDLCGSNVLIDDAMHARLVGFGFLDVETANLFDYTETAVIAQVREEIKHAGSIRWMAPEQFSNTPTRTFESDVFSFGRLCLEVGHSGCGYLWTTGFTFEIFPTQVFTLKQPYFDLEIGRPVIREVIEGRPPPRPSVGTFIPDEWWTLMLHCWEKDPSARPTMKDIINMLKGDLFKVEL
ncbi:hypothetical protein JAAARDRAFT_123824, partial [Jaapia argillacea MUCL 33604]